MKPLASLIVASLLLAAAPLFGETVNVGPGQSLQGAANKLNPGDIAKYWEQQWSLLKAHVAWARLPVAVLKPAMLIDGKPDVPWPRDKVDVDKAFQDHHCLIWETDRDALDVILRRSRALLEGLRRTFGLKLVNEASALAELEANAKTTPTESPRRKELFLQACAVRRRIAFQNPLLDFDEILFMEGRGGTSSRMGSHLRALRLGPGRVITAKSRGPHILSDFKTMAPKVRRVLPDHIQIDGEAVDLAKQGRAAFHINYDLAFDGKTLLFVAAGKRESGFNIYKYKLGADKVTQLTQTRWDPGYVPDWEGQVRRAYPGNGYPCWLPDGRIAYASERAAKGDRCEGSTATLHSMKADGSDSYPISWHESPEYHPVVDFDGALVYTRWDYVDRNWDAAQCFWRCFPDGRDPRAPHANYRYPFFRSDTFKGYWLTPWSELHIRPIPGAPGEYVAIAATHHHMLPGVPILINLKSRDDAMMAQVRLLVGHPLPNEGGSPYRKGRPGEYAKAGPFAHSRNALAGFNYFTPWPLSRDFHLISDNANNLLLLDRYGNTVLLCHWTGNGAYSPRPLRATPRPPIIPTATWQGARFGRPDHRRATIAVSDVCEYDLGWPEGVVEQRRIKALRIVQLLPLPVDHTDPYLKGAKENAQGAAIAPVGDSARQEARTVLGTVPVEQDGSAYFEAPVGKLIYFQALDARGMAIMSMRSGTYVHPGEQLSCLGCHEDKWRTPKTRYESLATRRAPSPIAPEPDGSNPLSYYRLVKPVFEGKCLPCHRKEGKGLQDFSYAALSLRKAIWTIGTRNPNKDPTTRSEPYKIGAHGSKMGQALLKTHLDRLTPEEFRRVVVWLDCASPEYGTWFDQEGQRQGKVVWHPLEVDPANPLGVEVDRPLGKESLHELPQGDGDESGR